MAFDELLASRIEKHLKGKKGMTSKKMFGGLAFLLNGKMICGVLKNDLVARVGLENYEKSLAKPHVRKMNFTKREAKGFVYVSTLGLKTEKQLTYWLDLTIQNALSL